MSLELESHTLLTAEEVALLLRTTRAVIYDKAAKGLLPGVTRFDRRLLFRRDRVLAWLRDSCILSASEAGRQP